MDSIPNWKKILLDWINNSGFLKKNYINLEQSDINEFFTKFISKIHTHNAPSYVDVVTFLTDQYENFEINLDDEDQLSSADYVYCYSLLLHYCCVKNPNEYFHKICENLPDQHQEAISKLFNGLLATDLINKTNLRHVIGDASPRQLLPKANDSPIIMKSPSNLKFLPSTPKSNMLEERTRELHILRAQLDTEKYDKSLLEMQLKQNEDKIKKITQQERKHLTEIRELKNALYTCSYENCSPNKSNNENQITKRLFKQMAEKDEEALTFKENNKILMEEQKMFQERLKLSDKEILRLTDKITSMDDKFSNFSRELEQKNYEIRILNEEKDELKQFIDESRSISNGRDLNSSIECLDTSLSRNTSSSGSIQSPENLGVSVIDIQLREKIIENTQLFKEMEQLKYENKSLSKYVCDLLRSNSDVFDVCNENLLANDVDGNNLTQIFLVFENYMKTLIQNYTEGKLAIKRLNDDQNTLTIQNSNFIKTISELETSITNLKTELTQLDHEKFQIESNNDSLKINQDDLNTKIAILSKERETYLSVIKDLKLKLCKLETERKKDSSKYSEQMNDIFKDIQQKSSRIEELEILNDELNCRTVQLQQKLLDSDKNFENSKETSSNLQQSINKLEIDVNELCKEISNLEDKLIQKQSVEKENLTLNETLKETFAEKQSLEKDNFSLNVILKENNKNVDELREKITALEADLELKEKLIDKLKKIISDKTEHNLHNDMKIQKITNQVLNFEADKDNLEKKLTNLETQNLKLKEELENLETKLMESIALNDNLIIEISKLNKNCEENENTIKEFKEKLENVRSVLTTKENEFTLIERQYKEKLVENIKFQQQYEEFVNKLKEMEEKHQQLSNENMESNELNGVFKQQLKDAQIKLKDAIEANCILLEYKKEIGESNSNHQIELLNLNNLLTDYKANNEEHLKTIDEINNLLKASEESLIDKKYENTNLELKLQEKTDENLKLEDECTQLTNKLSKIVEKLRILTNGSSNETDNIENLLIALDEQRNQLIELAKQAEEEYNKHIFDLNEKITELSQEKNDIHNDRINLTKLYKEKCEELVNTHKQTGFQIKQISDEIRNKSLEIKIPSLEVLTYENLMESIKIILAFNSEKNNQILIFERKIKSLSGKLEEESTARFNLEKIKSMLTDQIEVLNKNINDMSEKCEIINIKYLNSDEENMKLKCDILKKEKELDNRDLNSIELKEKTEECLTLKDNITNAKENLEEMQKNLKDITEEKTNIALKLTKLNEKYIKMDAHRLQLEIDLENTKKVLENQNDKMLLLEEQIQTREQNNLNLQEEVSSILDKNKTLNADFEKLQKETENDNLKKNKEVGNKILFLEGTIKENELKLKEVQIQFEKIEKENSELYENIHQHEEDSIELNKKLEKNYRRLEDYEKNSSKMEKEITQLKNQIKAANANNDNLHRGQSRLEAELKMFKEKSEAANASFFVEKCKLEEDIKQIKGQLSKALNSEMEVRDEFKQEIAKLTNDNKYFEKKNIDLTHKIGELNKIIEDSKKHELNLKKEFTENLDKLETASTNLKDINETLINELKDVKEVKISVEDNLSKTVIKLSTLQSNFDNTEVELNRWRKMLDEVKIRNDLLENKNLSLLKQLEELKLIEEENKIKNLKTSDMEQELIKYIDQLDNKETKIIQLSRQIEELKIKNSKELEENKNKLCQIKSKYDQLEQLYQTEVIASEELKKNMKIFEAKLYKGREKAEDDEKQWIEEKAKLVSEKKENRVELEGKLEKMKTKMKTLYNEEVEKLKSKYGREIFDYQAQLQVLGHKKEKYEEHCQILSKQIFNLNERIVVLERDNKFMETKLKNSELYKTDSMKRSQSNKFYNLGPPSNSISNKFHMEDEEGEIFNNTYLTDLKEGRMSDFGVRESISCKEMQFRNSLAPPHLRSTYLAQYKEPEPDIKDGMPVNLDDSLSSLLNVDKRKKMAGTSYKRPGPPTPSKTSGRLSFGGNNEVHPSILKESNDDGNKKTPAKFKLSKTSKVEKPQKSASSKQTECRVSNKFKPMTRHLHLGFQSSTPRKSKIRFHPIHALEQYSNPNNDTESESVTSTLNTQTYTSNQVFETPQNSSKFKAWRQKKIVYNSVTTSDSNSPLVIESDIIKKKNNRRVSIYDHGNIYSRSRVPRRNENHKRKAKIDRAKNFNKYRRSLHEVNLRKSILSQNFHNDNTTLFPSTISSITSHNDDERFSNIIGNQLIYNTDITLNNDTNMNGHQFEKFIEQIESTAPFEINTNISDKLNTNTFNIDSNQQLKIYSNEINETKNEFSTNGSVFSGTSTSNSKTLYPSNIIVNRKIPCLNKTEVKVRHSSFYIKHGNVIFGPNTKITIKDLFEIRNRISVDVKIIFLLCTIIIIFLLSYIISWMRG